MLGSACIIPFSCLSILHSKTPLHWAIFACMDVLRDFILVAYLVWCILIIGFGNWRTREFYDVMMDLYQIAMDVYTSSSHLHDGTLHTPLSLIIFIRDRVTLSAGQSHSLFGGGSRTRHHVRIANSVPNGRGGKSTNYGIADDQNRFASRKQVLPCSQTLIPNHRSQSTLFQPQLGRGSTKRLSSWQDEAKLVS